MTTATDIIFVDNCIECKQGFEYLYYDKCKECFVNSLQDIICRGNNKYLCSNINCRKCFNKSFLSSDKVNYFSLKNKINPRDICKSTAKKYLFNCWNKECNHEFERGLNSIKSGVGCPFCCNPPKQLCKDNDCIICFNKSFASSHRAKY